MLYKLKQHGLAERLDSEARRQLLERIKDLEHQGYELEAAEGTFELLVREALHPGWSVFEVVNYDVTTRLVGGTTATVTLRIQDSVHTASATGQGPMNALDLCLRQCLSNVYPQVKNVRLTDYKVRVLEPKKGTAAKVRVLVEWSDHRRSWATVGRLRQRDRSQLGRACGRHPPGADAPDRARRKRRQGCGRLLLGRLVRALEW